MKKPKNIKGTGSIFTRDGSSYLTSATGLVASS